MRIAYHNPWINSSENQGFMSMKAAADRIGVTLIACGDETAIDACQPDFVISVASAMAKITDYPTYLTVHEPKTVLLEETRRRNNLFSYDGYLTISDSLVRLIKDICAGVGRAEEPGFYYLTPQISDLACDWTRPDRAATLEVVYFGTNWTRRLPLLLRALDLMGIMRIHGPEESWRAQGYASYRGPVGFDGAGPQRIYAECGIGLAMMDERWQREDVISNRIFEISSVGAVSICPDMPWSRKWFGDSVLYIDPSRPMPDIANQIRAHHAFCTSNPAQAASMGAEARRIFETHFAAERMLENAVAYHHRRTEERARRRAAMEPSPDISVIVRCGGRSRDILLRAVESIRRQTFGRFTVILAKYRDIDLSEMTSDVSGAIDRFDEFLIEGGKRTEMLWAGLARIKTPYFAVLDDDDFWLSDHMEELFRAGRRVDPDFDMAFSGSIDFDYPQPYNYGTQFCSRNIGRFGFSAPITDPWQLMETIGINAFVARTDLIADHLAPPDMRTAEDSLLIALAARRSKPIFSFRPTAFYRRDAADGSNWQADPQRVDDEISFALRAGLAFAPHWIAADSFITPKRMWADARVKLATKYIGEILDRLTIGAPGLWSRDGISAVRGARGHIFFGPYLSLAPGDYTVIFLVTPDPDAPDSEEGPGIIEICSHTLDRILIQQDLPAGATEVAMQFTVTPEMGDPRIEFRIFSRGTHAFTVTSVAVYRGSAAAAVPPSHPPAPPPPPSAGETEPRPIRTPLRRIAGLVRRQP